MVRIFRDVWSTNPFKVLLGNSYIPVATGEEKTKTSVRMYLLNADLYNDEFSKRVAECTTFATDRISLIVIDPPPVVGKDNKGT